MNDNTPVTHSNQINPKNVKIAKLSSGESILLYLRSMTSEQIQCELPVRIITMPIHGQEYVNYGLTPMVEMGSSRLVSINRQHIISMEDASLEAAQLFSQFAAAQNKNDHQKAMSQVRKQRQKELNNQKPKLVYQQEDHPIFSDERNKAYLESIDLSLEDEIH